MSEDPEREEGVCVACKAASQGVMQLPGGLELEVCEECREDGSLVVWLTNELERIAPEIGLEPCGRTADGKRNLWREKV